MELLFSDIPPVRTKNDSFSDKFVQLISEADHLRIASGYISTESLTEIKWIIEKYDKPSLELMIGMHYFDGITRPQYQAAMCLHNFLCSKNKGYVSVATTFKFHGKLYSFEKNGALFAGIIGSSNLDSMLKIHRSFEADMLVTEKEIVLNLDNFIKEASSKISKPISEWSSPNFIEHNKLLEDLESVEKVDNSTLLAIEKTLNQVVFDLPLKASENHQKSNLNVYFGKGRENKATGFYKPRPWYEVEIIVPKTITDNPNYPSKDKTLTVYTDDGWKLECKVNGQNKKNFRSKKGLTILGRWLKGRLENSGVLQVGEPVTEAILEEYGRKTLQLKGTSNPHVWVLDFGVNNG